MFLGERDNFGGVVHRFRGAGGHGRADFGRDAARFDFRAERADGGGLRTDPRHAGVDDRLREFRVFGKETVPGVDGVDMRLVRGFHDGRDVEIRALRVGSAQCVGLVGGVHEQRVRVGVGIGGDGDAAGVMAGVDDAHGDFATVGDEDAP